MSIVLCFSSTPDSRRVVLTKLSFDWNTWRTRQKLNLKNSKIRLQIRRLLRIMRSGGDPCEKTSIRQRLFIELWAIFFNICLRFQDISLSLIYTPRYVDSAAVFMGLPISISKPTKLRTINGADNNDDNLVSLTMVAFIIICFIWTAVLLGAQFQFWACGDHSRCNVSRRLLHAVIIATTAIVLIRIHKSVEIFLFAVTKAGAAGERFV